MGLMFTVFIVLYLLVAVVLFFAAWFVMVAEPEGEQTRRYANTKLKAIGILVFLAVMALVWPFSVFWGAVNRSDDVVE